MRIIMRRLVGEGPELSGKLGEPVFHLGRPSHGLEGILAPRPPATPRQDDRQDQEKKRHAPGREHRKPQAYGCIADTEQDRLEVHGRRAYVDSMP